MKKAISRIRNNLQTSFLDLLFNLLFMFVVLFIIAFVHIDPIGENKNQDIPKQAQYLIVMTWDEGADVDIDLWVKNNEGVYVGFLLQDREFMHLERDDIGMQNEVYGEGLEEQNRKYKNNLNEETVVFRAAPYGSYTVNAHYYRGEVVQQSGNSTTSLKFVDKPVTVTIKLLKLNPSYEVVFTTKKVMDQDDQEFTFFNFDIDQEGLVNVSTINQVPHLFVNSLLGAVE